MLMTDALKANKNIIINTDIDGILSGLILKNYLGCKVVGFSNSCDKIWADMSMINSIYDAVYIDMFVPFNFVTTIDQHIICYNDKHYENIIKCGNKFNPNLDNPRLFLPKESYYKKYPFGTVHYICAVLEKEGIHINLDLNNSNGEIEFGELILRADDAMTTTLNSNYMDNAKEWWKWLKNESNDGKCINDFITYLNNVNPSDALSIKGKMKNIFINKFNCSSPDGGFKEILDKNNNIRDEIYNYVSYVTDLSKLSPFEIPKNISVFIGPPKRITLSSEKANELINFGTINGETVFSYGFVRSPYAENNFSYTITG